MSNYRVQRGTAVFGASSATTTVTLDHATDPARAFPFLSSSQHAGSGRDVADTTLLNNDDLGATITGWDGTEFVLTRAASAEAVDHRYEWQVWEDRTEDQAADGWYVRGIKLVTFSVGDSNLVTPAYTGVVDEANCIPIIVSVGGGATDRRWGEMRCTVQMIGGGGGTVRVRRDPVSDTTRCQAYVAVIEFGSRWVVNNNLISVVASPAPTYTDFTGAGIALPWENKFFFWSYRCSEGLDTMSIFTPIAFPGADNDTIRVRLDPTALAYTAEPRIVAHVAYHPLLRVEHRNTDEDGLDPINGDVGSTTLLRSHALGDTGVLGSPSSPGALGYPGGHWVWSMPDEDTITWRRGRFFPGPMRYAYQAIQLPRVTPAGGDSIGVAAYATGPRRTGVPSECGFSVGPRAKNATAAPRERGGASWPGGR